jgi:diadenosine tetraphosphate (Ap4A) HIT family hydrolase
VAHYHTLVLPKRHVANFFELYQPELNAVHALLHKMEFQIRDIDQQVTAFNLGINVGHDAGQTIFHAHVHMIPRRVGDVENPRGGVRAVIPGKQAY